MPANTKNKPEQRGNILIVGGYGQVGLSIAKLLAPQFSDRVIVAGRNGEKARLAAADAGHGAQARAMDIFSANAANALDGVALVVACLDQADTGFVRQCLALGVHYVDISADHSFLSKVENLDELARLNKATAVLSVGVAPGLSNMLARRAVAVSGPVERIDILLELGLGDHHGAAALGWMFDNLNTRFEVREAGKLKRVQSFSEAKRLPLPGRKKPRLAYRFSFPDQQVIARTLDIASVSTWLRFDSRLATAAFALLARSGLGSLLRRGWPRKSMLWLFSNIHLGSDICGVAVCVNDQAGTSAQAGLFGIIGRKEAEITAIVAAETVRQVLTGEPAAGVVHSDQVIALDAVIDALKKEQPELVALL